MSSSGAGAPGRTVYYLGKRGANPAGHEASGHRVLAQRLAALLGFPFGGDFIEAAAAPQAFTAGSGAGPYLVPGDTLDAEDAERLGMRGECDLFGGVVPHPFVATKTITHALVSPGAQAPQGWSHAFPELVRGVVFRGYSAFAFDDALEAGTRLLADGPVRLKLAVGVGGLGQATARDAKALRHALEEFDAGGVLEKGVVLEANMEDISTYSVGCARLGDLVVSYYGQQRLTHNHRGNEVYGGSDLVLVRGDFDALLARPLKPHMRRALEQASTYHAAAGRCYPGLFASRCNYDVAQGRDAAGVMQAGVLEQSWRIGGASGAEVAALAAFQRDPELQVVRASTNEHYGDAPMLPDEAIVYFSGDDPKVGRLTKYGWITGYGDE